MFQNSADEKKRDLTQACVTIPSEKRFFRFPKRNVSVHPAAIVAKDWFWHERDGLVVLPRDVANDVLVDCIESLICLSGAKRMSISVCPAVATS